jgi:hypothetical protein
MNSYSKSLLTLSLCFATATIFAAQKPGSRPKQKGTPAALGRDGRARVLLRGQQDIQPERQQGQVINGLSQDDYDAEKNEEPKVDCILDAADFAQRHMPAPAPAPQQQQQKRNQPSVICLIDPANFVPASIPAPAPAQGPTARLISSKNKQQQGNHFIAYSCVLLPEDETPYNGPAYHGQAVQMLAKLPRKAQAKIIKDLNAEFNSVADDKGDEKKQEGGK